MDQLAKVIRYSDQELHTLVWLGVLGGMSLSRADLAG